MNYSDGQAVMAGDIVTYGGSSGTVVCAIDDRRGTPGFPIEDWAYLERGIMLDTAKFGLIHLDEADEDLALVRRGDVRG